ncbi:MAG: hypothetical protein H7831_16865, partial [Magnetococcus sp. WYHC-3]
TVVNQYDYDAFGNTRPEKTFETVPNRYRFQGREWDAYAGHYFYRMRTYVPEWGSFTGPDMNLANGIEGESNGLGNYLAMGNDPLRMKDPRGLSPLTPNWVNRISAWLWRKMGNENKARAAEQDLTWNKLINESNEGFDVLAMTMPYRANLARKNPLPVEFVQGQMASRAALAYSAAAGETVFGGAYVGAVAPAAAVNGAIISGGIQGMKQVISGKYSGKDLALSAGSGWFAGPLFAGNAQMGFGGRLFNTTILGYGTCQSYSQIPELQARGASGRAIAGQVFEGTAGFVFTASSAISAYGALNSQWMYKPPANPQWAKSSKEHPIRYMIGSICIGNSAYNKSAGVDPTTKLPTIDPVSRTYGLGWLYIITHASPQTLFQQLPSGPTPEARSFMLDVTPSAGGGYETFNALLAKDEDR